ncbi:leucine-rich repeat and IQ domain-containing protein 3-like [Lytechinus variegatus]|uniref:leucine-rich repeat and IQ domain-containing protein 3-like n=1 Tax=Lytechinus variegatus TaxID=7654 RepID=UPI001BB24F2C|nr:leucine-rich repeat and IQ domain-containing protein 3-like [Lytechinus variegatus]
MLPANQIPNQQRQPQLLSWLHEQQRPRRLRNIMEKERNMQFLRQAQERGYLQSPSEASIIKVCQEQHQDVRKLEDVLLIRLCGVHLRDVGAVGACMNLRVCNLAGNYIRSFEALSACRRLVKLDLHSNQINQLPDERFWAEMNELRAVYLHDNSISRLDYLQAVGAAPNLQVMTLYDTPISLKMTYRHHVVNSVWSLKALDNHVISDEEIIEDAFFGDHFSMLNSSFYINMILPEKQATSLAVELAHVRAVLRMVSHIQAKHSPVLIIQRYIRGWLTRKAFNIMARTKVWAIVTIQRYWRAYKGLVWKPSTTEKKGRAAPPSTAALAVVPTKVSSAVPKAISPGPAMSSTATETSISRMDYDTYLKNRRPGSKSPVSHSVAERRQRLAELQHGKLVEEKDSITTPTTADGFVKRRANVVAKMRQLHGDLHLVSDEDPFLEGFGPGDPRPGLSRSMGQDYKKPRKPKEKKTKRKKSRTVPEMLGALSDSELLRDRSSDEYSDEEDTVVIKFRLSGLRPAVNRLDPVQDILISKREAGQDVRMGLAAAFTHKMRTTEPPQKPVHKKPMNADQKLFARAQGTMGMSCLKAVMQAYRDRETSDKLSAKVDKVAMIREQKAEGKLRAKNFLEEKRLKAMQKRDKEITRISHAYEKQANREIDELEKRRELRGKDSEITARVRKENTFSHEFGSQHTSISNALLRHDRQARGEKLLQEKEDFVQAEHKHEMSQRELVRRYLEHRQLMRQAQVAVEKAAHDTRVAEEHNDRLMDARMNVSRQKEKSRRFQAFYPLPKCPTHPVLPPVRREGKPGQWDTLISMYEGRVGNHPAIMGTL